MGEMVGPCEAHGPFGKLYFKSIHVTPGVMAHRYRPFWYPGTGKKVPYSNPVVCR